MSFAVDMSIFESISGSKPKICLLIYFQASVAGLSSVSSSSSVRAYSGRIPNKTHGSTGEDPYLLKGPDNLLKSPDTALLQSPHSPYYKVGTLGPVDPAERILGSKIYPFVLDQL